MWRAVLLAVFLLAPVLSQADESDPAGAAFQLKVRPVLCITDERTPSCQMSFLVVWQSAQTGYYCLYNDFADAALRCWTDNLSGELTDERRVDTEFSYRMTGDNAETVLAEVAVEVLRMDTSDRRRNRRNRHVWDIL